ncbi:hypothetical protein AURDEDRAFT_185853 [Auricularia subglabra TFB-10046 SS5]|nr:hypothetical protein AURDEDRAFT_185853 [Auricularia subglabra TFB-10046 SS5]
MASRDQRASSRRRNGGSGTAQQSARRVNSVYDLTSLRLHPDGLRAQDPSSRIWTGGRFHRPAALQDKHGNVLAPDAVGMPYAIRKRPASPRHRKQRDSDDEEDFEDDFDYSDEDQPQYKGRTRLRRSFAADLSFLDEPAENEEKQREEMRRQYHPSSDLLKYVHYHASELYAADGILSNVNIPINESSHAQSGPSTRASTPTHRSASSSHASSSSSSSSSENEDNTSVKAQDPTPLTDPEELLKRQKWKKKTGLPRGRPTTSGTWKPRKELAEKRARDPNRKQRVKAKRNMYRAFDGSALFCIGLLLQEHIAKMIDQPLRLSLDAELAKLNDAELQERYEQAAEDLRAEEEDDIEKDVRRILREEHGRL